MVEAGTRAGFVAVLGAPNVGKSTLVNRLVGAKVAIVSPKVQTTRSRLRGIRVIDEVQLVFVDTPGIFAAKHRFERAMVHAAWSGAHDADAILLLVDARRGLTGETSAIIDRLGSSNGGALSPEETVNGCLDLVGPVPASAETRASLIDHVSRRGDVRLGEGRDEESEQRVGELLSLIASSPEYQFA